MRMPLRIKICDHLRLLCSQMRNLPVWGVQRATQPIWVRHPIQVVVWEMEIGELDLVVHKVLVRAPFFCHYPDRNWQNSREPAYANSIDPSSTDPSRRKLICCSYGLPQSTNTNKHRLTWPLALTSSISATRTCTNIYELCSYWFCWVWYECRIESQQSSWICRQRI